LGIAKTKDLRHEPDFGPPIWPKENKMASKAISKSHSKAKHHERQQQQQQQQQQ